MGVDLGDEIFEEDDEEGLIRYYFFKGFKNEEIRLFLLRNHNIEISLITLKRRIKRYGLKRQRPDYNIDEVKVAIQQNINGHGCLQGCMAHTTTQRNESTVDRYGTASWINRPRRHRVKKGSSPKKEFFFSMSTMGAHDVGVF